VKVTTWEEALRLNNTPGYTAQDCLREADKLRTLRREGGKAVRRSWAILDRQERNCEKHGAYESHLEQLKPAPDHPMFKPRWTSCPGCDKDIELEQEASKPMSHNMKRTLDGIRMAEAGVGELFLHKSLEGYYGQHSKVVQAYAAKIDEHVQVGKSLVLCGPRGVGKTHAGAAILRRVVVEMMGTGKFTTQERFISRLKAAMNPGGEKQDAIWKELTTVDLLVVDEVGRGSGSQYEKDMMFKLINLRYEAACKPLVILSNLTVAELAAYLGDAWRRLVRNTEGDGGASAGIILDIKPHADQRNRKPEKDS